MDTATPQETPAKHQQPPLELQLAPSQTHDQIHAATERNYFSDGDVLVLASSPWGHTFIQWGSMSLSGYKWDYTFRQWGYTSLSLLQGHTCRIHHRLMTIYFPWFHPTFTPRLVKCYRCRSPIIPRYTFPWTRGNDAAGSSRSPWLGTVKAPNVAGNAISFLRPSAQLYITPSI
jgi:hypothetical protein